MDYSLQDLEKHFNVKKEEAALLFIFLTLLAPGNSVTFLNGRIEKMTEETFKLCIDFETYREIADDFLLEKKEVYNEIFPCEENLDAEER